MALIKCPKCGKEISDKAKNCVKCGWKVDLNELEQEEKLDSCQSDFKTDSLNVENERKKMLKETGADIMSIDIITCPLDMFLPAVAHGSLWDLSSLGSDANRR